MTVKIEQLFIYPVKSLQGIAVEQATLLSTGLEYDRFWMIINAQNQFITQRQFPQLASISVSISDTSLVLKQAEQGEISISLSNNSQDIFAANVWKDDCQVISEPTIANQFLSDFIGEPVKLVRMANNHHRPQNKPDLLGADTHTYFADAAPYLICNLASLDSVNKALAIENAAPVEIINFRPNIVLSGLEAFAEHAIETMHSEHCEFSLRYACKRCVIPSIDLTTYQQRADNQPYKILSEINPMPDNPKAPAFGENAILLNGANTQINVGQMLSYK